jgi:rhamnulokinase
MNPVDMPLAIQEYCRKTNQFIPQGVGAIVRCIFDSLAMKYKNVLSQLQELSPFPIEVLHIIGGGSKNSYLNQLTANALGIPVIAGPAEATAIGNILTQARATKNIQSLEEMREIVKNSFPADTFYPENILAWENGFQQYLGTLKIQSARN